MTQHQNPQSHPQPRSIGDLIPDDGTTGALLDLAAAADAEQPGFVQDSADRRRVLGELGMNDIASLETTDQHAPTQPSHSADKKYSRTWGDVDAEALVDYADAMDAWKTGDDKLKAEASMRVKTLHNRHPGDQDESELYARELEALRNHFGNPKPVRPTRREE